jgi:hypothetical protein
MRAISLGFAAACSIALAGCGDKLEITNPNTPGLESATNDPRSAASRLIGGVIATYRGNRAGSISSFGSYGRETYNMSIQDGRNVTGPYRDWVQLNAFTAGSEWAARYGNYRNIYETIKILQIEGGGITPAEQAGGLGVLNTFLALDLLHVAEARGIIGGPVDMTDDVNAVHPFVSQDSLYKFISAKLDEANTSLAAAGGTFYFPMHTGFSAFGVAANTPAGFARFNRAIKARVEAKRGSLGCGATCYNAALTALTGSFIADITTANRDNGVYVVYSTATGDVLNGVSFANNTNLFVHPSIDGLPGVALDDRYRRKVDTHEASGAENDACTATYTTRTLVSVTASNRPCTYAPNVAPVPIIRNEELVLLRAEARWFTGDQAGAIADLAAVRAQSGSSAGGTSSVLFANPANDTEFVDELLLQRTLSLFQEGHRYVDHRRFGRLAALGTLAQDVAAGFTVAPYIVLPQGECDSRARLGAPAERSCPGGPQ